jgi:histidinol-phosphate/aromatic aminotransferase/cobyric acid decarboxylase-like protein
MPEVAEVIANLATTDYPTETFRQNYDPGLDTLHLNLMNTFWQSSVREVIEDAFDYGGLKYQYYTNGSSEGLFHLLARHAAYFPHVPLYQFTGEYQGYRGYAHAIDRDITDVPFGTDPNTLTPGVFIISTPSAVDGNVFPVSTLERIYEKHYVILDLAYAGMTKPIGPKIKLHPRIAAVVGSMSKPFGLYYHRIGFLWSRDPVNSLYGNKWFKNAFSIKVGEEVLAHYSATDLASRYREWQHRACEEASALLDAQVIPSDVWLLGHVAYNPIKTNPNLTPFKRGLGYRLCLTPYFMKYAKCVI